MTEPRIRAIRDEDVPWSEADSFRESFDDEAAARSDGEWDAAHEATLRAQIAGPRARPLDYCPDCGRPCPVCGHILPRRLLGARVDVPCHNCGARVGDE